MRGTRGDGWLALGPFRTIFIPKSAVTLLHSAEAPPLCFPLTTPTATCQRCAPHPVSALNRHFALPCPRSLLSYIQRRQKEAQQYLPRAVLCFCHCCSSHRRPDVKLLGSPCCRHCLSASLCECLLSPVLRVQRGAYRRDVCPQALGGSPRRHGCHHRTTCAHHLHCYMPCH